MGSPAPTKVGISPISFLRSPAMEEEFIRFGLTEHIGTGPIPEGQWAFVKIRRSEIDREKSRKNQSRLDSPIILENLARMGKAMEQGTKMPAVAVWRDEIRYVLIDGNHRDEKSDGYEYMNAYVVNFTKDTAGENVKRWLTKSAANDLNGQLPSDSTKIHHAVDEVEEHGMSEEEASKVFGVPKNKIREGRQLLRFNAVFSGVPKAGSLDEKVKRELAQAVDKVTLIAANKLAEAAISNPAVNANQIREFCDQYKGCTSVKEQQSMLDNIPKKFACEIQQKTAGGIIKPNRGKAVLTKAGLITKVDKLIQIMRLPQNGVAVSLTPEEQIRVETLSGLLAGILNAAKSSKKVLS